MTFKEEISMFRRVCFALFLTFVSMSPAFADLDRDVADARELFLQGDYAAAMAVLQPAADAGHMRAQNLVGAAAQYGNGAPQDAATALRYLTLSADQGYPPALNNLGYLYEGGMPGVPIDLVKARDFYARAAALDYAPGISGLAQMMVNGEGGEIDLVQALRHFTRAAELGNPMAFEWLGWMNRTGTGMPENFAAARHNYQLAGMLGITAAWNEYGVLLEQGSGGDIDLRGAMDAYQQAIAGGFGGGGINAAWLVFENPDLYPDQVQGLAYCFWAVAHAAPADLAEYTQSCDEVAAGYSATDRRLAEKAAAAM
jgi:uncharacterized protein